MMRGLLFLMPESVYIGLCQIIFGKDHLLAGTTLEKMSQVDSILIGLPLAIIVIIVVGILTRPKYDTGHVDQCFKGVVSKK